MATATGEILYRFYIKNYLQSGTIRTTEQQFMTIPFSSDIIPIQEPKIKNEIGKAGSFEFSMDRGFQYYSSIVPMRTMFRVEYCGVTIFRGRVLTVDNEDIYGHRSVHCEGDFAFLMDSQQEGIKDEARSKVRGYEYLNTVITNHNTAMGSDNDKKFTLGEVPNHYSSSIDKHQKVECSKKDNYGNSSWSSSMNCLEDLADRFGGYFRTRYVNGTTYIDWLDAYYNSSVNAQSFSISSNVLGVQNNSEVDELFTVLIPIGASDNGDQLYIDDYWPTVNSSHAKVKYIEVPEIVSLYSDDELNRRYHKKSDYQNAITNHGRIYKVENFAYAYTREDLFNYAKDYILNNYIGELYSYTVNAIDLKTVDNSISPLYVGDRVRLTIKNPDTSTEETLSLTVMSAEKDLFNPESDSYVFGTPNGIINATYGNKKKNGKGGKGGSGGGISGGSDNDSGNGDGSDALTKKQWYDQFNNKLERQDITYDDPTAMFFYNTDGSKKTAEEVKKGLEGLSNSERKYVLDRKNLTTSRIAPTKYYNDAPVSLQRKITTWKNNVVQNIISTGVPRDIAVNIVNDRAQTEKLASFVDDDGNPTGPYSQELIGAATKARDILKGKNGPDFPALNPQGNSTLTNVFDSVTDVVASAMSVTGDFTVPGGMDVNSLTGQTTFFGKSNPSQEGGDDNKKVISEIGGNEQTVRVGSESGGSWRVKLDEEVTYKDEEDKTRTAKGFVSAQDFKLPTVASFKTKLIVTDTLITNTINTVDLKADKADVDDLVAKAITADNINTQLEVVNRLVVKNLTSDGDIRAVNMFYNGYAMYRRVIVITDGEGNRKTIRYFGWGADDGTNQ